MRTGRRSRAAAAALAGWALGASVAVATPVPAAATPADSDALVFVGTDGTVAVHRDGTDVGRDDLPLHHAATAFAGDFSTASEGTSVFLYNPGPYPESILDMSSGEDGTGVSFSISPETVTGTYTPLVGDFDGNGLDDILWYGPGAVADSLWLYRGIESRRVVPLTIRGTYEPVVVKVDGDGRDDIVWYAPGPAADSIWTFGFDAVPTSRPVTIDGHYDLVPGRFGVRPPGYPEERLVFSRPGGPDPIWTFDPEGGHVSETLSLPAGEPVVADVLGDGRDAIFWYTPGALPESLTSFTAGGAASTAPAPPVNGRYVPVVGDFDGDGAEGIAWTARGRATVWRFDGEAPAGYTQTYVDTGLTDSVALVAHPGVEPG